MDGVGFALIAQRMAQVYSARVKGVAASGAPSGLYRCCSRMMPATAPLCNLQRKAYWLKHCTDWPKAVTLADRQAPALYHRLRQTAYLSSQSVRTYAPDASRLAQLVTAAIAVYLHCLTGTRNVVLGFPVTARLGEDRRIPGTASNVLPIRLTVPSDTSLSSSVEQAAQEIQRGFRHQRYHYEELRRGLRHVPSRRLFGPSQYHDV